ncbi:hypothetical protein QR90_06720 [Deinococcus radiopugnans]|uniref:Uncharacterized protein n=1 Tax=Deinococcus radiopugnans TaxID=57497 RepID=A0A0A7KFD7_9DEIO|nr:hypothetical protein [Deinococcus radiopugnans]AIZ44862.1 hypothetical protein QR90_06720 [Deinococcus radiopugnans]
MKNLKHQADRKGGVILPLTVAAGTLSGQVVTLGAAGLFGIATTDRVTPEQATSGLHPQGYKSGQAGVLLPGIGLTIDVLPLTGIADYAKVYVAAGVYSATNTGTFVGWRINATTLAVRNNA